ncbi:unnamed protein product [Tetraodon nigroviridis]|uniref:(spotted green pufferfish) hypothetical protein n=1 Tax=Tetraodon nigroviridis TaxID=99883 RepID=Q4SDF9_TETNG|nr:unnamed protein product [Tetraodon nigroviridis]
MSHPSEGDQRRVESNRMQAELQGGASRSQPSRQGYCGYCRVLYRNLDQHLASLKHLDSVNICCQGSDPPSTSTSVRARQTLMERFLNDVLQHHPHHYQDNRPSHADLPWISTLPVPRKQLDEAACFSDGRHLLGPCERLSNNNPHMSHQLANQVGATQLVSPQTPVQVRQIEDQHVSRLMAVQVDLEDQTYAHQLERALQSQQRAGGDARLGEGFWSLPIDQVLPAPEHIPESFKGKTWAQIEQEDEEKVEKLVQQFRKEKFICYFDSESLARFGRRSRRNEQPFEMVFVSDSHVRPLLDCQTDASGCVKKRKRRLFKMASRCQFYEPSSNRILKIPSESGLPHQGSTSSSIPPSCVRQLFRSLSPDLNADSHSFLLKTLRRDADAARGQNRAAHSRSERGRAFGTMRTCLPTTKGRSEALPTHAPHQKGPSRKVFKSGGSRNSVPFNQRGSSRGRSRKRRRR